MIHCITLIDERKGNFKKDRLFLGWGWVDGWRVDWYIGVLFFILSRATEKMITDPITANELLNNIHSGHCKHCRQIFLLNKNGMLRKHKGCEQDYPDSISIWGSDKKQYLIRLDDLALIAMQHP